MGDTLFHFRIWQHPDAIGDLKKIRTLDTEDARPGMKAKVIRKRVELTENQARYNREGMRALKIDPAVLFGFVYFRQRRDAKLKRGYLQKSVVLLSRWMLPNLWFAVLKLISPEYFKRDDRTMLECVARDIERWSKAEAGKEMLLPVMGSLFRCRIPQIADSVGHVRDVDDSRMVETGAAASPVISIPLVHKINVYEALYTVVSHLHLIWELSESRWRFPLIFFNSHFPQPSSKNRW